MPGQVTPHREVDRRNRIVSDQFDNSARREIAHLAVQHKQQLAAGAVSAVDDDVIGAGHFLERHGHEATLPGEWEGSNRCSAPERPP